MFYKQMWLKNSIKTMLLFSIVLLSMVIVSCGGSSDELPAGAAGGGGGMGGGGTYTIIVTASPGTITAGTNSTVTATVLDQNSAPAPDGTQVSFSVQNGLGTMNTLGTTINGVATQTFTAGNVPGAEVVTGSISGASDSAVIIINAASGGTGTVGTISVTASPSNLQTGNTSIIVANVLDATGSAVPDGTLVDFSIANGLGTITAFGTTISGNATVTFTAGDMAGAEIITASALGTSGNIVVIISIGSGSGAGSVGSITATATPSSITVGGTSSIAATVLDTSSQPVPDGTIVEFASLDGLGSINQQATTTGGVAIVTFLAGQTPGSANVSIKAGITTVNVNITIIAAATGSIEFLSATPQVIGLQGSGQTENSIVTFNVKDVNGNPVVDGIQVDFTMNGPNGGEYIDPVTASTNNGGLAKTVLHSGTVAGPVTVVATVTVSGVPFSSSSSVISIGGGVPSAKHFTIATTILNLPGLEFVNEQADISAFLADRFGNYNVLQGTSISFYAEAGAIDASNTVDTTGGTQVVFRTQNPMPNDVAPDGAISAADNDWQYVCSPHPIWGTNPGICNPRDGLVTVLATAMGEEAFNDANGNGVYELGESFSDLGEPFFDRNDDGCYNDGTSKFCPPAYTAAADNDPDPFEEFIDGDGDGNWDPPNGVWDGPNCPGANCRTTKLISVSHKILFTGQPGIIFMNSGCSAPISSFAVTDGGSTSICVWIGDVFSNLPIGGTKINPSLTGGGQMISAGSITVPDSNSPGPYFYFVTVQDNASGDTDPPKASLLKIDVDWHGLKIFSTISGTVD